MIWPTAAPGGVAEPLISSITTDRIVASVRPSGKGAVIVEAPEMKDAITSSRQFVFLLVDKFSMFSLAAAIDTIRSTNRITGKDFYRWSTVSPDGESVPRPRIAAC